MKTFTFVFATAGLAVAALLSGCVPPDGGYYSPSSSYDPYPSRYDNDDYYRDRRERDRYDRERRDYERDRREDSRRDRERHDMERDRREAERREHERREQERRQHDLQREQQRQGCDSGWSSRGNKCSGDERKKGCQDKRAPNGDLCVRFR